MCRVLQELQEGCAEVDPLRREVEDLSAQLVATEDELKVWGCVRGGLLQLGMFIYVYLSINEVGDLFTYILYVNR